MDETLFALAAVPILGISASWMSWRLKFPSIVVLLLFGFIAGPITGFINPELLLGKTLLPLVSISVAIILFEGGLSLRLSDFKKIGSVVIKLVTIGVFMTWVLATAAAYFFLKWPLPLSLLLGAILTITGPTVIAPMLRSLRLSNQMGSVLKWEAMLNDPIGAILSVLIFEAILAGTLDQGPLWVFWGLVKTVAVGIGFGIFAGWLLKYFFVRHWVPEFLHSSVALIFVIAVYILSNLIQAEAGLIAVTLMGFFLTNQKDITIKHIIEFKENLQIILIASIFILLAARLELSYFTHIGLPTVLFLCVLLLVIRPVAVFASTWKSDFNVRERTFLALMAPRGIVAAAVSSVFAFELNRAQLDHAGDLLSVTFLVIIVTVTFYGLAASKIARMLKIEQPNPQGTLIAGAHPAAQAIAAELNKNGFETLLVDNNWFNVNQALRNGLRATTANILSGELIDELRLAGIGKFLGMTPNDEVNSLAALRFAELFGRAEVYQIAPFNREQSDTGEGMRQRLHGSFLFQNDLSFSSLNQKFQTQGRIKTVLLDKDYNYEAFKAQHGQRAMALFVITDSHELKVMTAKNPPVPRDGQALIVLEYEKAE
ncbi:MAG: cation:proton antiporter [Candidatus Omnitrophica bacterium]|nr:cation:proton antiporter [Candidatus Omnitrophota bacterium]